MLHQTCTSRKKYQKTECQKSKGSLILADKRAIHKITQHKLQRFIQFLHYNNSLKLKNTKTMTKGTTYPLQ